MDIVVVLELDVPSNVRVLSPDRTPADPQHPVRRAHAVLVGGSGTCGPSTLCGLDSGEMTLAPHRPADPDQPWWPPHWHACSFCQAARQNTTPTTGPADADLPEAATASS
ncbi:hypothetical protein [Kitasatospora herbaricolor]|uniref:Uncharacterized protein n=1 Tax=Kitasatospora herbaricolor TaxID=68217 RepID=A0ABZ1W1B7_9ACTN|nr:hypothetical protein [Kitasatospora herbaricolor]